jgi:hypothetical protein
MAPAQRNASRLVGVTREELDLQPETLELINTELAARLERQSDSSAKIDTKAVVLAGYVVAAASFLATQHPEPILAGFAYAAYAIAAGLGVSAYAVRAFRDVPDPRRLFNGYARQPKTQTLAALAAERVKAFEENAGRQRRKARQWKFSTAALLAGVIFMVLSIIVHNGEHGKTARPRATATAAAVATHRGI